jgi:hypothetical protein
MGILEYMENAIINPCSIITESPFKVIKYDFTDKKIKSDIRNPLRYLLITLLPLRGISAGV